MKLRPFLRFLIFCGEPIHYNCSKIIVMNKSRFQDAYVLLRAAMCQFRASCIEKHGHSSRRSKKRGADFLLGAGADDSLIRGGDNRNQCTSMMVISLARGSSIRVSGRFDRCKPTAVIGRTSSECDSPTCVEPTASFGLDAKFFTGVASVYRDGCEQSLE